MKNIEKNNMPDTIEDLLVYAMSAVDALRLVHNEIENCEDCVIAAGAMYGILYHLEGVLEALDRQVLKIPDETLRRIAEECAK